MVLTHLKTLTLTCKASGQLAWLLQVSESHFDHGLPGSRVSITITNQKDIISDNFDPSLELALKTSGVKLIPRGIRK